MALAATTDRRRLLPLWSGFALLGAVGPARAQVAAPARLWSLSLHVQESWNKNAAAGPGNVHLFTDSAGVGLTHSRQGARSRLALGAQGAGLAHHSAVGAQRFSYTGSGAWSYRVSERALLSVSESLRDEYTQAAPLLVDEGLIHPLVRTRTHSGSASIFQRLSPRTGLTVGARHSRARFDDPALPAGSLLSAGADIAQQVSAVTSLNASYSYLRSTTVGRDTRTQSAHAGWSRALAASWHLNASLGVSRLAFEGSDERRLRLTGGAGVVGRLQSAGLVLRYGRSVSQAFGFGRDRVADVVTAGVQRPLGRRWNGSLSGVNAWNRDPLDPAFSFRTQSYTGALTYAPGPRLTLAGSYSFRRRSLAGAAANTHAASLGAAYAWQWQ